MENGNHKNIHNLNVRLLKIIKNIIIIPPTKLINLWLVGGIFPSVLKKAVVIPIYNKGEQINISNYRHISLLPILSKILEKSMAIKIKNYFEINNLFSKHQIGFRHRKSTTFRLLDPLSNVMDPFESIKYLCSLSFFSKSSIAKLSLIQHETK